MSSWPIELLRGPFVGSDVVERGLLTRAQLRGASWRRIFRDVYTAADMPDSHQLRCQATALILPAGAVITGRSAACARSLPLGEITDPVRVLAPPGCRFSRRGIQVRRTTWLPATHFRPGSERITVDTRTAWEIASEPDLIEAVIGLDVLFGHHRPRKEAMAGWVSSRPYARATRAIALADGTAASPQETRARVKMALAGFPPPIPQYTVVSGGQFVARVDFAWPAAKVAVEYDGLWHVGDRPQMAYDRVRLSILQRAGWEIQFLTEPDLSDDARFARFCDRLRGALGI